MKATKIKDAGLAIAEFEDMQRDMQLVSEQQVCGWFNVNRLTLIRAGIPRVQILPNVVRYRVADVKKFIQERSEPAS